ncbi:MAG: cytochrome c [Proteobacteria bacterium]|nr:cytochrome c [Pseudomonadota bacterium]
MDSGAHRKTPRQTRSNHAVPPELAAPRAEATGQQIYLSVGCAGCHGQDAGGSAIAPSLPGHTAEQVKRQVRAPIGAMPRFGDDAISDNELDRLVEYIVSLSGSAAHQEPVGLALDDVVAMHHWMVLTALKADNVIEAQHHVQHAVDLIADLTHRQQMEVVLADLDGGHFHDAEHAIEGMLAGTAEPELTSAELHLQMTLSAIVVEAADDAAHHLEHFLVDAAGPLRDAAAEAIELLAAGSFHDAEDEVQRMLEGMPHQHHRH